MTYSPPSVLQAAIDAILASAPGALNTLDELAAALGDDANYAATITALLALKAPLTSPAFTGNPTAPTPGAGDNDTSIATSAYAMAAAPNASWRAILDSSGSHIAGRVGGLYGIGQGDPLAITGTGTLYPVNIMRIAAADYPTINGLAAKLRVRAVLNVNNVTPTGNFTVGLHPVTRPASSGGAGLMIYSIGSIIANSGAVFTGPVADDQLTAIGSEIDLPSDGFYCLAVTTTQTVAASSLVQISAFLQQRNA